MRTAYIAMGANIPSPAGPPASTLAAAVERLSSIGRIVRRSSLYSTAPVGFDKQPRFLNAVIALETALSPHALLESLLQVEQEYARNRSIGQRNGPRTLDLDILMLGDLRLCESDLEIPHPRLAERAFVLVPLHEIAPEIVVPRHRATVAQLLDRLRAGSDTATADIVAIHDDLWPAGPDSTPGSSPSPAA